MINQEKIKEWVDLYLGHIKEITPEVHVRDEEGYKFKAVDNFQKNFNESAKNFPEMLEKSISNNNLVAGSWYFPRKMLLIFATEYEKETRSLLADLFNEDKPVASRIDSAREIIEKLITDRNKKLNESSHAFMGLRFFSLLLGYRYPNRYNAMKPREWRSFCKYINDDFSIPNGTSRGEQYEIYSQHVDALRKYIMTISQINELRGQLTDGLDFHDDEFKWMVQDVIYVTARLFAKGSVDENSQDDSENKSKEEIVEEVDEVESLTIDNRFVYEEGLQHFIQDNFGNINFGDKLQIYTDDQGRQGLYYPTEYGEIDILATDNNGNYVVLELKRNKAADKTVNQLGRYMQWVEENLALKNKKSVRGIIIAHQGSKLLHGAIKALRFPVTIKTYNLKLELTDLE